VVSITPTSATLVPASARLRRHRSSAEATEADEIRRRAAGRDVDEEALLSFIERHVVVLDGAARHP
jgi:hypothetical protein